MKTQFAFVLALGLTFPWQVSLAATTGAVFTGAVENTCVLTVGTPGVITPNSAYTVMSSKNALGSQSTVAALVTGGTFSVSTVAPSSFTVGDSTNVSFASSYSLSGATSATDITGLTATQILPGVTNIEVDLTATKSTSNFVTGAYNATVTVRCE